MIVLSILAALLTVVILVQNPTGSNQTLALQIGAKKNKSFLNVATWSLAVGLVLLTLVL
jgi:preprotein translocase subunit SecG